MSKLSIDFGDAFDEYPVELGKEIQRILADNMDELVEDIQNGYAKGEIHNEDGDLVCVWKLEE